MLADTTGTLWLKTKMESEYTWVCKLDADKERELPEDKLGN